MRTNKTKVGGSGGRKRVEVDGGGEASSNAEIWIRRRIDEKVAFFAVSDRKEEKTGKSGSEVGDGGRGDEEQ